MILRGTGDHQLTLEVAELGSPGTPEHGDLLLNIRVVVGDYSAADQSWVVAGDWQRFLAELRELERCRRGQAILVGASPDEFEIRFANTDRAGHMSVTGRIGWHTFDRFFQKLDFGFAFDPGMLASVLRELGSITR